MISNGSKIRYKSSQFIRNKDEEARRLRAETLVRTKTTYFSEIGQRHPRREREQSVFLCLCSLFFLPFPSNFKDSEETQSNLLFPGEAPNPGSFPLRFLLSTWKLGNRFSAVDTFFLPSSQQFPFFPVESDQLSCLVGVSQDLALARSVWPKARRESHQLLI